MLGQLRAILRKFKNNRRWVKLRRDLDIGEGTRIESSVPDGMFPELIHIGKNCIIAPQSRILTHDASYYLFTGEYLVAPVYIGDNCFIGYGAIIMPGVKIGSNVVVGAGSVVTRDIPEDSVVAGVPARVISSLSQYLYNRRKKQLFIAPYAGKSPAEISQNDIAIFKKQIYLTIRRN